ncbi:helix-turn-helix transcriptional regulator [Virgibacillus halodenitrificans]|uniref:TetR/AcrR family transcriptional regulator n=1 Tax=Virgibacillus halodenitrificans TaxID=1482 RepID=UPI001F1CE574|nr:TetR/AcrR family transcriptional regulator [Virgibacillus halodenitrificans]MCG1028182.1 helix-turn-helix transcriptional regulator [Virgibacillus halodenitrificans]
MNEKKLSLLLAGMKLFAQKGYHQTSIQEIANEAGVSKGAFYIYFQSKEDFITTVFSHFYTQIKEKMTEVDEKKQHPRENLANQIAVLTEYIASYKDLITMHLRENISIGENTDKIIKEMKLQNFYWMKDKITAIYGSKLDDLLIDTIIQLEGLLNGYLKWMVIDNIQVDKNEIGPFIIRRLDEIVQGMLEKEEKPLLSAANIPDTYLYEQQLSQVALDDVIAGIGKKLNDLNLDISKKAQLQKVVETIKEEAVKEEPSPIIIQGLLAHFSAIPMLQLESEQLADIFNVELLN